jgi:hypothetical protein
VGDVTRRSRDSVSKGSLTLVEGSACRRRALPFRWVSGVKWRLVRTVAVPWMAPERQPRWIFGTATVRETALTP